MTTPSADDVLATVVTITLNAGDGLRRTALSVVAQSYPRIEWIVVDGGSRDGSLAHVTAHGARVGRLISEPDRGIADAMNKGLRHATGEVIIYMNAGDAFTDAGSVARMVRCLQRSRRGWAACGAVVQDVHGTPLYERHPTARTPGRLVRYGCRVFHAAVVARTGLLRSVGGFDTRYSIAMDYDLWVRLLARGARPALCASVVSGFRLGGVSGNVLRRWRQDFLARRRAGLDSGCVVEMALYAVASLKQLAARSRLAWMYRLKEALRL